MTDELTTYLYNGEKLYNNNFTTPLTNDKGINNLNSLHIAVLHITIYKRGIQFFWICVGLWDVFYFFVFRLG